MVGFRKELYYINKFGEEVGKQKYKEVVSDRVTRATRRSIKFIATDESIQTGDAVRCLACGKIFKRITRTHLKNKCVKNITPEEYRSNYPNAEITARNLNKLFSNTEESIKEKYGNDLGSVKWRSYKDIQAETNTFEYKAKKYNMSKEEFDIYNKNRSSTIENFIERYGEEIGIDKWDAYCERQRYTTTIDYFIEKYGEDEGTIKWEKFYTDRIEAPCNRSSAQEMVVLKQLTELGLDLIHQHKIRKGRTFIYDYANIEKKLLIEYNGNIWHMNPTIYKENSIQPRTNLLAKDVWERDRKKRKVAEENGYSLYVIWEKDWKKNKDKIINEIRKLYNEN